MLTEAQALEVIRRELRRKETLGAPPLVLLADQTVTRQFGWVFFYQSRRFLETGNVSDSLAGNAPLIVDKADGSVHQTGTARPIEDYISKFESQRAVRVGQAEKCPRCESSLFGSSEELALTIRPDDGKRWCRQIFTCASCGGKSWRWNDGHEALQPFDG